VLASDRLQPDRARCRPCRPPASADFIRREPFVGATNYNPNFRIRGRGTPRPLVAAMRAEIGEQGGPPQVLGRLEQGRFRIFLPLSLSLHEAHGLLARNAIATFAGTRPASCRWPAGTRGRSSIARKTGTREQSRPAMRVP